MTLEGSCKVCRLSKKDRTDVEQLIENGVSLKAVAAEYNIPVRELKRHMKLHTKKAMGKVETSTGIEYDEHYRLANLEKFKSMSGEQILESMVPKIAERIEVLLTGDPDSATINKQITLLIEALRKACMSIAELKRELASETHITLIQFNTLRSLVLEELPPEYRKKIIDKLGDVIDADSL